MPKIFVSIEWDVPEEKDWLTAYNLELLLAETQPKTAFMVTDCSDLLEACEYGHDEHALERLAQRLETVDGFSGFVLFLRRKAELERAAVALATDTDDDPATD